MQAALVTPGPAAGPPLALRKWGPGLGLMVAVFAAARLSVPQPIAPEVVPLPEVDARAFALEQARRSEELTALREHALPVETRAIGELLRRVGRAEHEGDPREAEHLRSSLRRQLRQELRSGREAELAQLRTLQGVIMADAVLAWNGRDEPTSDLIELASNLLPRIAPLIQAGVRLQRAELEALARVRFSTLLGLEQHLRLSPSVNDLRLSARLQLRYAEGMPASDRHRFELATVSALAKIDDGYPANFALGVVHFRLGDYPAAFDAFSRHLQAQPDGPWALRAQNHATAAAQRFVVVDVD